MLAFNLRLNIYALVIGQCLDNMAYIVCVIGGIFNKEEEKVSDVNGSPFYLSRLEILRDSNDNILVYNMYVDAFFVHNDNDWKYRNLMPFHYSYCNRMP